MPLAYALIHEEAGLFGISFPDFPGCVSGGATAEEALRKGSEVLTFHVEGMEEDGEPLPTPRSLAELQEDPEYRAASKGAVVALIPFERPSKSVRVNVSIDENLLNAVDAAARATGKSRSAYLAAALQKALKAA